MMRTATVLMLMMSLVAGLSTPAGRGVQQAAALTFQSVSCGAITFYR